VREKINSDPKAQIALIVVLALVGVFAFLKMSGGGEEAEEGTPTEATVSVAGTGVTGTATGASAGEAVEGAVVGALEATAAGVTASAVPSSIPTPPLPHPVAAAYDSGKTVVLLVVHNGGIDDRLVTGAVRRLGGEPDLALFVVPAKRIARYAAITLGAEVEQVPALLVMRPRKLSGGSPEVSVDYGFQTPQGVAQAVIDARYKGPEETYHPD
jgi:hypothetical protein